MRKNIKHYYLYFFALIFSVVLYFVFSTLQYDSAVMESTEMSVKMNSAFKTATILLIVIVGIFVFYANTIFLRRRSREIGLYQLIGLTRGAVARLLIIENILLSVGAMLIGIGVGMLVSRVFLLLLMKLVGHEGVIALSFSSAAVIQTAVVFFAIIILTSLQMVYVVYRHSLIQLFNLERTGEHPKKPKPFLAALMAITGVALIVYGYWLSGRMMNSQLFYNMLIVLGSTIGGTYLLFRVAIGWLFYHIRKGKKGHLGINNSLSIASLMHRLKGNANSLTIITVLSAMTLALIAGSYSLYYSTEKETRYMMPFDFMFQDENEELFLQFTNELDQAGIKYANSSIEMVNVTGSFDKITGEIPHEWLPGSFTVSLISDKNLQKAGLDINVEGQKKGSFYNVSTMYLLNKVDLPFTVELTSVDKKEMIMIQHAGEGNVINLSFGGSQIVVDDEYYQNIKQEFIEQKGEDSAKVGTVFAVKVLNKSELTTASEIYQQQKYGKSDYYSKLQEDIQANGLLIFIAGFLGLVFLISTGSILYFKQMTEAEQEKKNYTTLRQLGFSVSEIMKGLVSKQSFVFGLPLLIGLSHSIFAIKSASFLFQSDITLPVVISMGVYGVIYLIFAFLTVGYYKKVVKAAL